MKSYTSKLTFCQPKNLQHTCNFFAHKKNWKASQRISLPNDIIYATHAILKNNKNNNTQTKQPTAEPETFIFQNLHEMLEF